MIKGIDSYEAVKVKMNDEPPHLTTLPPALTDSPELNMLDAMRKNNPVFNFDNKKDEIF